MELSSDPLFPTPQWRVAWAGRKLVVWSVAVFGSRLQGDAEGRKFGHLKEGAMADWGKERASWMLIVNELRERG